MEVTDLVDNTDAGIELVAACTEQARHAAVTWCVSTESIDPSPFLTPGALVLTSGMALNVTDVRIWDAYVERLVTAQTSALAFGLGPAHGTVPAGLVFACADRDLPLLVIPARISFAHVQREIQDRLSSERYDLVQRGSLLADECTRIAAAQGTVQDVLDRISEVVHAPVSIKDYTGANLLSAGSQYAAGASAGGASGSGQIGGAVAGLPVDAGRLDAGQLGVGRLGVAAPGRRGEHGEPHQGTIEFSMPGNEAEGFRLVVEARQDFAPPKVLLAPVAAVLAMQLNSTLGADSIIQSRHARALTERIYAGPGAAPTELASLGQRAGLEPHRFIGLAVIQVGAGRSRMFLRTVSWRVRVALGRRAWRVRYVDEPELSTLLVQGDGLDQAELLEAIDAVVAGAGRGAGVSAVVGSAESVLELALMLRRARRALGEPGTATVAALDLETIVDTLNQPGVLALARGLVEPLRASYDGTLWATLAAYLRHSGATAEICADLFIHRNTLSYRLRRIQELLQVDLRAGEVRAVLFLAVRLIGQEENPGVW